MFTLAASQIQLKCINMMAKRDTLKAFAFALILTPVLVLAQTPELNIRLQHNSRPEHLRMGQIRRLAAKYDLKKYTITRDIVIDETAINHSYPVLTMNLRFGDNDDRVLSIYVHEQAHWVLGERHRRQWREMLLDLRQMYPNLRIEPPHGDGKEGSSYMHLVVIMLEWQALEELIGAGRARDVLKFKREQNYKDLFTTVMNNRDQMEKFLKRYEVKW
jgi:endonuclease/exonuclease/phosphatase (EEP) superfamily protein YafD